MVLKIRRLPDENVQGQGWIYIADVDTIAWEIRMLEKGYQQLPVDYGCKVTTCISQTEPFTTKDGKLRVHFVHVTRKEGLAPVLIAFNTEAFLIGGDGKTIDRIH